MAQVILAASVYRARNFDTALSIICIRTLECNHHATFCDWRGIQARAKNHFPLRFTGISLYSLLIVWLSAAEEDLRSTLQISIPLERFRARVSSFRGRRHIFVSPSIVRFYGCVRSVESRAGYNHA